MQSIVQMFLEGGVAMYGVLAIDSCAALLVPVALLITLVARFTNKGRTVALVFGVLAVLVAVLPMCTGAVGYFMGMSNVEAAVEGVDPQYRELILKQGEAEASNNLTFGFSSGCCLLVPAVLALLLVPAKQVTYDDAV